MSSRLTTQYFTGSQAVIYINDMPLAEVTSIMGIYTAGQIPIYGYKSYHFDTVIMGKAIANGTFTVNYTNNGYILAHINKAKEQKNSEDKTVEEALSSTRVHLPNETNLPNATGEYFQPLTDFSTSYNNMETLLYAQEVDAETIKTLKNTYWKCPDEGTPVHPEFIGPLQIKIRDFRIGSYADSTDYEEKVFIDAFIRTQQTTRESSAAPVSVGYEFIAKVLI